MPKSRRTSRGKEGGKCVTKTEERDCDPRGGCSQTCDDIKKKCTCHPGYYILTDGKCIL